MTQFQLVTLIAHDFLGVAAVIFSYAVWMQLVKQEPNFHSLRMTTLWAWILTMISWVTGGYYYLTYYGKTIRPLILAGKHPWAHSVMTEAKEHFFLFLPFLTFVLYLIIRTSHSAMMKDVRLKKTVTVLAAVIALLGIAVTLFGVAISGAAHK